MVVVLHKILVKCSNSCCSSVHHSTSGANEGGSGNAYDDRDLKQTSKDSKECQILAHVTEAPKKKKKSMKVHCSLTTAMTFSIARRLVFASETVETGAGR